MKQGSNNRRSRSRGGGKRHSGGGRNNFESNGPDVKIRGSAQQVQEKYLALARDASSAGDWVSAEAFFQFAEHYYRIINSEANIANGKGQSQGQNKGQGQGQGQGQVGRNAKKQPSAVPEAQVSVGADSPDGAEVTDTSPAALAAAVTERETEQTEATKSSKDADQTEPKKVAS